MPGKVAQQGLPGAPGPKGERGDFGPFGEKGLQWLIELNFYFIKNYSILL